jgi:hypothetical protein
VRIEKDYEELLGLFNKYRVKYCIVGAFAVAFYAIPRYSKDMDILVEPSSENGRRIVKALEEFGFGALKLKETDFSREGRFVQLGYEPVRLDLITSISGVTFEEVWKNRAVGTYGKKKVYFIGLNELLKTKETAGRKQDMADVEIIRKGKIRTRSRAG